MVLYVQLSTNCVLDHFITVQILFLKYQNPIPQLVDNCTYGTIAIPFIKSSLVSRLKCKSLVPILSPKFLILNFAFQHFNIYTLFILWWLKANAKYIFKLVNVPTRLKCKCYSFSVAKCIYFIVSYGFAEWVREIIKGSVMYCYLTTN